jgi:FKBP-type peptidyl-prolyl cis-trans isomerase FkpA
MARKKILLIVGACIVIACLGTGLVVVLKHNNTKPVNNNVSTRNASSNSSLPVGDSSPGNGIEQAGGSQNSSPSATNDTQAQITAMTNPSNFGQYDTAKYKNASEAFFANLQTGTGTTLSKAGQKAVIIYRGWLTNGKLFDETQVNSKGQNEAFEYTYGANPAQVIPGLEEGMAGMKVGGVRLLIVPPAAGYGAKANGSIPANSVLIFEVQLAEIQ